MSNFLALHGTKNVWCTPDQDYQHVFQVARISRDLGVSKVCAVEWQTIPLPTSDGIYHVFSVGQVHPRHLGIGAKQKVWQSVDQLAKKEGVTINLYHKDGFQFPRKLAYVMVMGDRNVVIALRQVDVLSGRYVKPLFVRFYSNAYYSSQRSDGQSETLTCTGYTHWGSTQDLVSFQNLRNSFKAKVGLTLTFHNGRYVDDVQPGRMGLGDEAEFFYDASMRRRVVLKVKDLPTFDSVLDQKRKFLIYRDKANADAWIDYRDDIDIYLVKPGVNGRFSGVFYHRNKEDAVRMVTHNTYSIPVTYVQGYVNDHPDWSDINDLELHLFIRESGYKRPLVFEHNRLHELYKLTDQQIQEAMLGLESTVPNWRADHLEQSWYTALMRAQDDQITNDMVEKAYGYNAITQLVVPTPQKVDLMAGTRFVKLPVGFYDPSTMLEFDAQGKLLGFHVHNGGEYYNPIERGTRMIEAHRGIGSQQVSVIHGLTARTLDTRHNYRFYKSSKVAGVVTGNWVPAKEGVDFSFQNGQLAWTLNAVNWQGLVKSDEAFLLYRQQLAMDAGIYHLTLRSKEERSGNGYTDGDLTLPPRRISVWLNGYGLIENLDYFVSWPKVVLTNKEYLVDGTQDVVVMAEGFCQADMTPEPQPDVGFVEYGLLSMNQTINLRDDKNVRIVVGGCAKHRSEVAFVEDYPNVDATKLLQNGRPYQVDEIVNPLGVYTPTDTYVLREQSQAVDVIVETYVNGKRREPKLPGITPIPDRYRVYSPFVARLISDLDRGVLWDDRMIGRYDIPFMRSLLKSYEWLLDFEPTRKAVDDRYVVVHPHTYNSVFELNIYKLTFLKRAIEYYLEDKVNVNHFVSISDD